MPCDEKGMVQVYTGAGKGKTTAALGMCMRAAGHGMRCKVYQFMKGRIDYGELMAVKRFDGLIELIQGGRDCFVSKDCPADEDVKMAKETLVKAREAVLSGDIDILVLDEANVALDFGLIKIEDLLDIIEKKPENMELVLTGRNAAPEIIDRADLVTEMREVKHYWNKGVASRKGIEC